MPQINPLMPKILIMAVPLILVTLIGLVACGDSTATPATGPGPGQPVARLTQATFFPTEAPTATPDGPVGSPIPLRPLAVERAFPNLEFSLLTNLVQPDDGSDRFYTTEQRGLIRMLSDREDTAEASVFLDITDQTSRSANEEGLLGIAFDPKFQVNGFFYVYYSASSPRRSVVSRFSISDSNSNLASSDSELVILEIPQPAGNHNGGQLAFGPDKLLYIGSGYGGWSGDVFGNGQNLGTLLGSILRIDVSGANAGEPYSIPASNPFDGVYGNRGEIFAYGLRNPWRFSFDIGKPDMEKTPSEPVEIWVADVGQNQWEEIDLVRVGRNYGWNIMEGGHCFSPSSGCSDTGMEFPVAQYGRENGCSVTGGYVYRGKSLPSLAGASVFGDFCSGKIWGLRYDG